MIKEVFIKALNSIVTDKGPALYMMNHLKAIIYSAGPLSVTKLLRALMNTSLITPSLIWGVEHFSSAFELVVALPYDTAVLFGGVPDLGAEETAAVTAYQLRGEYGL